MNTPRGTTDVNAVLESMALDDPPPEIRGHQVNAYSLQYYNLRTYAMLEFDRETVEWVFPDRGRFVQWESSDLWWAKPICKVARVGVEKWWTVASINVPSDKAARKVMDVIEPEVRRRICVPRGFVLPVDYQNNSTAARNSVSLIRAS